MILGCGDYMGRAKMDLNELMNGGKDHLSFGRGHDLFLIYSHDENQKSCEEEEEFARTKTLPSARTFLSLRHLSTLPSRPRQPLTKVYIQACRDKLSQDETTMFVEAAVKDVSAISQGVRDWSHSFNVAS